MSSERTNVFSLLFAFMKKPRETLGYKKQNPISELKILKKMELND